MGSLYKNKPTLAIGHHLLEGNVVTLPKPLGVLHKHVRNTTSEDQQKEAWWDVTAVVKKKIVFSKRPMPIAKPASTASRR